MQLYTRFFSDSTAIQINRILRLIDLIKICGSVAQMGSHPKFWDHEERLLRSVAYRIQHCHGRESGFVVTYKGANEFKAASTMLSEPYQLAWLQF